MVCRRSPAVLEAIEVGIGVLLLHHHIHNAKIDNDSGVAEVNMLPSHAAVAGVTSCLCIGMTVSSCPASPGPASAGAVGLITAVV